MSQGAWGTLWGTLEDHIVAKYKSKAAADKEYKAYMLMAKVPDLFGVADLFGVDTRTCTSCDLLGCC